MYYTSVPAKGVRVGVCIPASHLLCLAFWFSLNRSVWGIEGLTWKPSCKKATQRVSQGISAGQGCLSALCSRPEILCADQCLASFQVSKKFAFCCSLKSCLWTKSLKLFFFFFSVLRFSFVVLWFWFSFGLWGFLCLLVAFYQLKNLSSHVPDVKELRKCSGDLFAFLKKILWSPTNKQVNSACFFLFALSVLMIVFLGWILILDRFGSILLIRAS